MSREQALGFFERVEGDPLYGYVSVGDLKGSFNVVYDDMSYPIPVVYDVTSLPNPGQDGQMFYISSTGDIVVWTKGAYKVNAQGEPGVEGPQGPPGVQAGPPGPVGLTGPAGPAGITGPQGPIGSVGSVGPQGNPGGGVTVLGAITDVNQPDTSNIVAGTMYIVGNGGCTHIGPYVLPAPAVVGEGLVWTGSSWVNVGPIRGPMGPFGSQGIQGAVGPTGSQGPAGSQGIQGPQGPAGIQGVKGDPGIQGATGSIGITGAEGPQGDTGPQGDKGDPGIQGTKGDKGDQGDAGTPGSPGPQGEGLALAGTSTAEPSSPTPNGVYMYIGDTLGYWGTGTPAPITLYPNECALWTGSVWINVGKIRGPVGLTGATGASGPTGAPGAQGPTGPQGQIGLQGPAGSTGAAGPMGPKGDTGDVGPTGIGLQGPAGSTGPAGSKGDTGSVGATGPQGPIGPQGPQGIKGDTGPQGSQGLKGDTGVVGATGATGVKGDTGLQGPQGLKGDKGNTGEGLTIRGVLSTQAQVNTANTTALEGYVYEVGGNGLSFTGITGSPVVGDIVTKTATGWLNNGALKGPAGPTGPTGPTAVSGNSGNGASLGTDGLIFVPDTANKQVIAGVGLSGGGALTANVTLAVKPGAGLILAPITGTVDVSFGTANNQVARGDHGHTDMPLLNGSRSFTGAVTIDQGTASVLTLKGTSAGGAKIVLAADGTSTIVTVTGGIAVKDSTLAAYRNLEVAAPTANQHAATKQYVDSKIIASAATPTGANVVDGTVWVQI